MNSTTTTPNWIRWIAVHKQEAAYVLFGLAAALMGLCLWLLWKEPKNWLGEAVFSAVLGAIALAGGVWYLNREGDTLNQDQAARILLLAIGALAGLCLELVAIWRTVDWWDWITHSEKWQGQGSWRLIYWLAVAFVGLGLMFFSLMLGRQQEESHPVLRRIIYGYNTVLVIELTFFLLVVTNVVAFSYVPATSDWTSERLYTLDESQSQNILKSLEEPVRITVLADFPGDPLVTEMTKLVDACRLYTNKIKFPITVYYKDKDRFDVEDLMAERNLTDEVGVLVDYGDEDPVKKWQFISRNDLFEQQPMMMRGGGTPAFKGEAAIMTALVKLQEDKQAVLYFTQGHGELTLQGRGLDAKSSASSLKRKLETFYTVKGLNLGSGGKAETEDAILSTSVPDDASVVVVAGYGRPFAADEVEALRKYARGSGKLLLLLGTVSDSDGNMIDSGLKPLLDDLGVELGNNRVMTYTVDRSDAERPLLLVKPPSFESAERKLAKSLEGISMRGVKDVRTVKAAPAPNSQYRVETILVAPGAQYPGVLFTWAEADLRKPWVDVVKDYFLDKDLNKQREKVLQKLADPNFTQEQSIGVTVSEGAPAMHGMPSNSKPKALIIGNSVLASDAAQDAGRRGAEGQSPAYTLVASSLGYLREKPQMIGIPPKEGKYFSLSEKGQQSKAAMRWLPLAFMFFGVLGLGLGIWVVRQR